MKVKAPFRILHRWNQRRERHYTVTQHFFYLFELRGREYFHSAVQLPIAKVFSNFRKAV